MKKIFKYKYLKDGKKRVVSIISTKKKKAKKYFQKHYLNNLEPNK